MRPAFDAAAAALVEAAELVDPNVDPVRSSSADERGRYAWRAIKNNVEIVARVGALVTTFGAKSPTFSLIELPAQLGGTGWLNDLALMCVDPKYSIEQASAAFNRPGVHRQSPWFLAASTLRLNSIDECRETVRVWAEATRESLGLNRGRDVMDPDKGFIATLIRNPVARKELAKG